MVIVIYTVIELYLLCVPSDAAANGDIRLVNGSHSREGRVEIYYNGKWGTVCDDGWDVNDAIVVCRQLNYYEGVARSYGSAKFGQGDEPTWLDDVNCTGREITLLSCPMQSIGMEDCTHSEDAGVSCPAADADGAIRLVNGRSPREGRVEIYYNGSWGTVCDDGWDVNDATVVCRQLNYFEGAALPFGQAAFGEGIGRIWLGNVNCSGIERTLFNCQKFNYACSHSEDAGVICPGAGDASGVISLTPSCSTTLYIREKDSVPCWCYLPTVVPFNGRLVWKLDGRIIANGTYGEKVLRFPGNVFTRRDSNKLATCETDRSVHQKSYFTKPVAYGPDSVNITVRELFDLRGKPHLVVICDVHEMNPKEESMVTWLGPCLGQKGFTCTVTDPQPGQTVRCFAYNKYSNKHSEASAVLEVSVPGAVRLVNGNHPREGRVEVLYNGTWGLVCSNSWDVSDAVVVCRQLK